MRDVNNLNVISNSLCSLGAHLGHLKVDAYHSLSYYVLGNRSSFMIIDLDKTVPMLKSALVFFEHMVNNYGHAVFCHSNIVHFSLQLNNYVSRLVDARNQSFSYWRWVPGCITNYRYVFLRLVELLFNEVQCSDNIRDYNIRLTKVYDKSFVSYYKRLWFWFLGELNIPLSRLSSSELSSVKSKFNLFFMRSKKVLLNKYLADVYNRSVSTFEFVRQASGFERSYVKSDIRDKLHNYSDDINDSHVVEDDDMIAQSLRTLPSFVSMLFRACYALKLKEAKIRKDFPNVVFDEEVLFRFLFSKLHTFWRAIIFFKCFRKTANLPDCLVMFNPDNSVSEFHDFIGVRLPIICLADTTTDISSITYPIPSNDDSIVLFLFYLHIFINACRSAEQNRAIRELFIV